MRSPSQRLLSIIAIAAIVQFVAVVVGAGLELAGPTLFIVSFWLLVGTGLILGAWLAWIGRRDRRKRVLTNHCPTCGYNLAGLNRDAGVCPECGRKKS